jgi:hypothetical protein
MKFQASVVFELRAESIADAGRKLDQLVKDAEDSHGVATSAVELRMPPADTAVASPVILPPVATPPRTPGPQAKVA